MSGANLLSEKFNLILNSDNEYVFSFINTHYPDVDINISDSGVEINSRNEEQFLTVLKILNICQRII